MLTSFIILVQRRLLGYCPTCNGPPGAPLLLLPRRKRAHSLVVQVNEPIHPVAQGMIAIVAFFFAVTFIGDCFR